MVKAAVLWETNNPLVVEEVELDEPQAGEVLVKVGAAGICRSDRHFMHGDAPIALPVVLGHEGAGTVEKVGPGVTSVRPGQQVILTFVPSCGRCKSCVTGKNHLCDNHGATGPNMYDGTTRLHKGDQRIHHMGKTACFAEYSVVPESGCVPIDVAIPMDKAALIGCCVPTGVGAVTSSANVQPGSTVAVVGCGGVGLNVIMGAALVNASKIIAVDIRESQLEFAMKFGATHTVNASDQDPVAQVKALTDGKGADYTFEVFGSADTTKAAYDMAGKSGTVTVVGIAPWGAEAGINAVDMVRNEKTMRGTYYGSTHASVEMPKLVDMYLAGKLNLDDLVVRQYALDDINEAYGDMDKGEVGRGVIMY
ncbi:MAG: Zn-dependent alcohol dehydrogenase [SAR202 cluster bacterium]|nr:Zn-dependent alcohol dehydrogenase [SAR202 cluster bacterium]MQG33804.1 Zn-dependent alcohol dehydrogenase [SAR202 cluster bacterium]HCP24816.1 alcohol dehydrogenase [Dehalococcoidia bacterium]|tara:strand:+ start:135 stop:1229 length:1095 start_codon:yes stop_codon:yes gene_type:complete